MRCETFHHQNSVIVLSFNLCITKKFVKFAFFGNWLNERAKQLSQLTLLLHVEHYLIYKQDKMMLKVKQKFGSRTEYFVFDSLRTAESAEKNIYDRSTFRFQTCYSNKSMI